VYAAYPRSDPPAVDIEFSFSGVRRLVEAQHGNCLTGSILRCEQRTTPFVVGPGQFNGKLSNIHKIVVGLIPNLNEFNARSGRRRAIVPDAESEAVGGRIGFQPIREPQSWSRGFRAKASSARARGRRS